METSKRKNCASCKFWDAENAVGMTNATGQKVNEVASCRANPPSITNIHLWPSVMADQMCGAWSARRED